MGETNSSRARSASRALAGRFRSWTAVAPSAGHPDTAALREVINRLDTQSLQALYRDHQTGGLHKKADSVGALGTPSSLSLATIGLGPNRTIYGSYNLCLGPRRYAPTCFSEARLGA
jgi:hypothetical protein